MGFYLSDLHERLCIFVAMPLRLPPVPIGEFDLLIRVCTMLGGVGQPDRGEQRHLGIVGNNRLSGALVQLIRLNSLRAIVTENVVLAHELHGIAQCIPHRAANQTAADGVLDSIFHM